MIKNEPFNTTELVVMDLVDENHNIVGPSAHYQRKITWDFLGYGGIETIAAAPEPMHLGPMAIGRSFPIMPEVTILQLGGITYAAVRIQALNINTLFSIVETREGADIAHYVAPNFQSGPAMEKMWSVPDNLRLFLLVCTQPGDRFVSKPAMLIGIHNDNLVKLPLPNIYEDGTLCLGGDSTFAVQSKVGIQDRLTEAYTALMVNPYNGDLNNNGNKCASLFRWGVDEEGTQQETPLDHNLVAITNPQLFRALRGLA